MEENGNYEVINVTDENFGKCFYELIKTNTEEFTQKYIPKTSLFQYLLNYLKFERSGLQVKTIVREKYYTCLNFLEDYANYYARCYTQYEKHCKRVHFFKDEFVDSDFEQMLQNPKHANWNGYVGCIVIKPLPKGIFGITHLKTYPETDTRYYTCLFEKTINLFGHDCHILTMPFKEQDGIVVSCVTTALWMAFQKTSKLFNTKAPSLSEVTILAGDKYSNSGKIFPSKGLEMYQVCKAITNNGLISEVRSDLTSNRFLKGLIYAYLKGGIPVLLTLRLPTNDEHHLVTANGYKFNPDNNVKYVSDEITCFYVHDDQIGPFSRLLINNKEEEIIDENDRKVKYDYSLVTSWWKKEKLHDWITQNNEFENKQENNKNNPESFMSSTPAYAIIPVSQVIKVTYEDIIEQQEIIEFVIGVFTDINCNFKWDIFITKSNEYKKWLIEQFGQKETRITDILTTSFPQYIWIIQAWIEDILIFDFIYDTVELNRTGQPAAVNVYHEGVSEAINSENMNVLCSNSFGKDTYRGSLMKIINELPYDFEEIKTWFKTFGDWEEAIKKKWINVPLTITSKTVSDDIVNALNKLGD